MLDQVGVKAGAGAQALAALRTIDDSSQSFGRTVDSDCKLTSGPPYLFLTV